MKVFIFGIDGAGPEVVNKWIKEGHLKNLKKIKQRGLSGKLKSIFPPLTGPAWPSFHTGTNPGKHGVYNWIDLSQSYEGKVINQKDIKTQTVWNNISNSGGKIGLVSFPITYPPEKVDGFVIPGLLTPSTGDSHSYPKKAAKLLSKEVPNFRYISPHYNPSSSPRKWVDELKETIVARRKASELLYKKYLSNSDSVTLATHFFSTDRVQHRLWNYREDDWDPRLEVFKETDRQIGKLMELAPDDSTFIVISDHGFGSVERIFNVNNWLRSEGFLKLKNDFSSVCKKKLSDIGLSERKLEPIGEKAFPLLKKLNLIDNYATDPLTNGIVSSLFLSNKDVDWKETKAYSRSDVGHVRLNLKGRENSGIVDKQSFDIVRKEIMAKLEQVKLPNGEGKLAEWVKPKEDVYHGPFLDDAPDVLFNPLPNATLGYGAIMFLSSQLFDTPIEPGHHRRNGILLAAGQEVTSCNKDAEITDIAPTLLNLFSLPIPEQMDGEVIKEIAPRDPSYRKPSDFYKTRKKGTESREAKKRLKDLGYL